MKIGKFVTTDCLELNNNDIALCIDKLQGTKLSFKENSDIIGRIYGQNLGSINLVGKHNYWGTFNKDRTFKATAKSISCYVNKKVGKIETNEIFKYVEGSEGTIQYSMSIKLYGDLKYKYQRGVMENVEIYSYYDYDTDLSELLKRGRKYYDNLL